MAGYGKTSLSRLNTCHKDLQEVMRLVISILPYTCPDSGLVITDCGIIEGHRGQLLQDTYFEQQKSQVKFPNGKHNTIPSMAVDTLPMSRGKYMWSDKDLQEAYAKLVMGVAEKVGVKLRWGADWDGDGIRVDKDNDEKFFDGPHFELVVVT